MNGLTRWRKTYEMAGIATIPLVRRSKTPICDAWQVLPPPAQWSDVGRRFRGNIGARCGGGLVIVDGDSPQSADNIRAGLVGLGLDPTESATATPGNRHFWLNIEDVPDGFNWCHLSPDIGPGELRGRNAYVVAPCSEVEDRRYRFVTGSPEALAQTKPAKWNDLAFLIASSSHRNDSAPLNSPPVRLVRRPAPIKAVVLLELLKGAPKAQPIVGYPTRSEGEAAVVTMLVLSGWSYDEIQAEFERARPGHYAEKRGVSKDRYLTLVYRNALGMLSSTPERTTLAQMYAEARVKPWAGRGGGLERKAHLGVLAVAWQFSCYDVNASQRIVAEHAGASGRGINKALKRNAANGLIHRLAWCGPTDATTWRIVESHGDESTNALKFPVVTVLGDNEPESGNARSNNKFPVVTVVRGEGAQEREARGEAELWARGKLGESAAMVLDALGGCDAGAENFEKPTGTPGKAQNVLSTVSKVSVTTGNLLLLTVKDLSESTGKHSNTIRKVLHKLAEFGLVTNHGGRPALWSLGERSLSDVAEALECKLHADRRQIRHEIQREAWHNVLARNKAGTLPVQGGES